LLFALIPLPIPNAAALVPGLKQMLPEQRVTSRARAAACTRSLTPLAAVPILVNSLVSLTPPGDHLARRALPERLAD
jgi:hypothetical protein